MRGLVFWGDAGSQAAWGWCSWKLHPGWLKPQSCSQSGSFLLAETSWTETFRSEASALAGEQRFCAGEKNPEVSSIVLCSIFLGQTQGLLVSCMES